MRVAALLLGAAPLWGVSLQFGPMVGVPLTTYFDTGRSGSVHGGAEYSAATRRYTLGISGQWRAAEHWGLEVDVLYHRMGYVGIVTFVGADVTTAAYDAKGGSWDFPLLLQYRFRRRWRPFAQGGGVLRYMGPIRARGEVRELAGGTRTPIDTTDPSDMRKRFYPGLTAGAGVERSVGCLRLRPEIRYSRWTANIAASGGLLRFTPNQVEILLGILF